MNSITPTILNTLHSLSISAIKHNQICVLAVTATTLMFAFLIECESEDEVELDQVELSLSTNRKINNHNKQRTWSAVSKRIAKLQHYRDESSEQSADDIKTQKIQQPLLIQHRQDVQQESSEDRLFYIFQQRLEDTH